MIARTRLAKGHVATQTRGQTSYLAGLAGEDIVARDYEQRGHPVCYRRWRGQSGEVDLIARDGDQVIFVEVKSGQSRLSKVERTLRDAIEAGNVSWFEYRVPRELTHREETRRTG